MHFTRHVHILHGLLVCGETEMFGQILPGYRYQVRDLNGAPESGSYYGPGYVSETRILLGAEDATQWGEYLVDATPTAESVEERRGYESRLRQLRATPPRDAGPAYLAGWQAAHADLARETPAARASRKATVRTMTA